MYLESFVARNFRNLTHLDLGSPSPRFNVIFGGNASGKTSLLEAIHLLGLGASFRSHDLDTVIQWNAPVATVVGRVVNAAGGRVQLGAEMARRGGFRAKVGGVECRGRSGLVKELSVVLLAADVHKLVEGGPGERRRHLDWGVFHVEQTYLSAWRVYRRALEQRNALLKVSKSGIDFEAWDEQVAQAGEVVTQLRLQYWRDAEASLRHFVGLLVSDSGEFTFDFVAGWREGVSLAEVLERTRVRDRALGWTSVGPHRADIRIRIGGRPVSEVLSRGQQKHLAYAMKLAQAAVVREVAGVDPVILVDDFTAELDVGRQNIVLDQLESLGSQVFVTTLDEGVWEAVAQRSNGIPALFHVEHGEVARVL